MCGSSARGTAAEAIKILKRRGQKTHFSSSAISVENYVHLFGHPSIEVQEKRIAEQNLAVGEICQKLLARETNKARLFRPFSAFVSGIFRSATHLFARRYRITPACNSCQICRKVCPPDAIFMKEIDDKLAPRFKARKCDHCQACMQLCPKNAIKYFKIKPDSPRYKHHNTTLRELIKRDWVNVVL